MSKTVLIFTLLMICSCAQKNESLSFPEEQNNDIILIEWSRFGGQLGYHEGLTITEDSVIHTYFTAASGNQIKESKYANSTDEWQELTKSIDLQNFRKIKHGVSKQPVDGTDDKIYIRSINSKDSILNGDQDAINYKNISTFIELLDKIRMEKK